MKTLRLIANRPHVREAISLLLAGLSLAGLLLASTWAHAGPLKNPRFAGDGCRPGSVQAIESPDGSSVTVLFDSFSAEAGGATGRPLARTYCDFDLPFQVPAGYRMAVAKIDYRGFSALGPQGRAALAVDYSFSKRKIDFRQVFNAGRAGEFTVTDRIGPVQLRWTTCGEQTSIVGRATLTVDAGPKVSEVMATLDTADGAIPARGGLVYQLRLQPCDPNAPSNLPIPVRMR